MKQELIFNCHSRWLEFIVVRKTWQQQERAREGSGIEEAPLILQICPQWCSWSSKTLLSKGFLTSKQCHQLGPGVQVHKHMLLIMLNLKPVGYQTQPQCQLGILFSEGCDRDSQNNTSYFYLFWSILFIQIQTVMRYSHC